MAHEALLANSHIHTDHGWVSQEFQRIAEVINDLDPTLFLMFIPEALREATDLTPYAVAQIRPGREPYIIFYLAENELDHRVIARILESKSDSAFERLDKTLAAQDLLRMKKEIEERAEKHELARSMWRSNKHEYTMPDGRKVQL